MEDVEVRPYHWSRDTSKARGLKRKMFLKQSLAVPNLWLVDGRALFDHQLGSRMYFEEVLGEWMTKAWRVVLYLSQG